MGGSEKVSREQFMADAERAFRLCYPDRWETLMRAIEQAWPEGLAEPVAWIEEEVAAARQRLVDREEVTPSLEVEIPAARAVRTVTASVQPGVQVGDGVFLREHGRGIEVHLTEYASEEAVIPWAVILEWEQSRCPDCGAMRAPSSSLRAAWEIARTNPDFPDWEQGIEVADGVEVIPEPRGLRVSVTDYHPAGEAVIPWALIRDWRAGCGHNG